eukprot:Pgem_evm1s8694
MYIGSGGTSTSIGRFLLLNEFTDTKLVIVDPEGIGSKNAVFKFGENYSLNRNLVTQIINVRGQVAIAAMRLLKKVTGVEAGPSSGVNFFGALRLAKEMHVNNQKGSIVTIICDGAVNYRDNYYDEQWLKEHDFLEEYSKWEKYIDSLWNE